MYRIRCRVRFDAGDRRIYVSRSYYYGVFSSKRTVRNILRRQKLHGNVDEIHGEYSKRPNSGYRYGYNMHICIDSVESKCVLLY